MLFGFGRPKPMVLMSMLYEDEGDNYNYESGKYLPLALHFLSANASACPLGQGNVQGRVSFAPTALLSMTANPARSYPKATRACGIHSLFLLVRMLLHETKKKVPTKHRRTATDLKGKSSPPQLSAFITVGIVDLKTGKCITGKQIKLPKQALFFKLIAHPPIERHFVITRGGLRKLVSTSNLSSLHGIAMSMLIFYLPTFRT